MNSRLLSPLELAVGRSNPYCARPLLFYPNIQAACTTGPPAETYWRLALSQCMWREFSWAKMVL